MSTRRLRPWVAQALVEFALVWPLMTVISLGVLQLVLYAHARDVVVSSVQEGARLASEDGRGLDEGYARTSAMISAGLGNSIEPPAVAGYQDLDIVSLRVDAALRPILPLPVGASLPLHAEARAARERFRPGGG